MVESSMKTISRPVIDRLPVNQLDEFACRQLDRVLFVFLSLRFWHCSQLFSLVGMLVQEHLLRTVKVHRVSRTAGR